jgi:hypothetical protein
MNRSLTGTEANLVVYFRCDEGTGSTLSDSAPASPNVIGTLTGNTAFVFPGVVPFPWPGVSCDSGAGACQTCIAVNGQLDSNTPVLLQSLGFFSPPSLCSPPRPCPGTDPDTAGQPVPTASHSFLNSSTNNLCITAQLHFGCTNPLTYTLGAVAYLGANSPGDPCVNYLGDCGFDGSQPFSFNVPAGASFTVLVSARATNIVCDTYTLELFGAPCPPPLLAISRESAPSRVRLDWSTAYPGWTAQGAPNVIGTYSDLGLVPAILNGRYVLTNLPAPSSGFFRLRQP